MGHVFQATCKECGTRFEASEGGGFHFVLLHCNQCGETASVGFDQLRKVHKKYLRKGEDFNPWKPKPTGYAKEVEKIAGACECGGQYEMDAPPRCPKCRSANYECGKTIINYD